MLYYGQIKEFWCGGCKVETIVTSYSDTRSSSPLVATLPPGACFTGDTLSCPVDDANQVLLGLPNLANPITSKDIPVSRRLTEPMTDMGQSPFRAIHSIEQCSYEDLPLPSPMWATKRSNDFTSVKSLADYHICERP